MRNNGMDGAVRRRFADLAPLLNERQRRLWAAAEAQQLGYGGVSRVARATGLSRPTIHAGLAELRGGLPAPPPDRVRRPGAGGKPLTRSQPGLTAALEALVEPTCRGAPDSPLRYCCTGARRLAEQLRRRGFRVGRQKVCELLADLGYSLQANAKTREGKQHQDRDAQFRHIAQRLGEFSAARQPAVSVDTKKKELLGDFKNPGRDWRPRGQPEPVRVHDFASKGCGKASPYGVYDVAANEGWVSVGLGPDTAAFAVQAIRRWWQVLGRPRYPGASGLMITADSGGSNSCRGRLWKLSLQEFADETGLAIGVSHYPPGTSKWNKIEHRLFSHIGMNWRGRPLTSAEEMARLIRATTSRTGLRVEAEVEPRVYPKGVRLKLRDLRHVRLQPAEFHGDWNYTISPAMR
jgi:hypothetical protein